MRRIKTVIFLAVALLMISTVTIFDPADITRDVLVRIIPERKIPETTDVVARVRFANPVTPGQTRVSVSPIKDLAGNVLARKEAQVKAPHLLPKPPQILGVMGLISSKGEPDRIVVVFSGPMAQSDAELAADFALTVDGRPLDVPKDHIRYHPLLCETVIELPAGTLAENKPCVLSAVNLHDVAQTVMARQECKVNVVKDRARTAVAKVVQNVQADPRGRAADVVFTAEVQPASAQDKDAYRIAGGPPPDTATLQPDKKTVRLVFADALLPKNTRLEVGNLVDAAGLFSLRADEVVVETADTAPPLLKSVEAVAAGSEKDKNDTIVLAFSKPLISESAVNLKSYSLETPPGTPADLGDAKAEYDAEKTRVTITLGAVNLQYGAEFVVKVKDVQDVSGNDVGPDTVSRGRVGGDNQPPKIALVKQNISDDASGGVIDVKFDEAVLGESATDVGKYRRSDGGAPLSALLQSDLITVRLFFEKPIIPGAHAITVGSVKDLAGNASAPTAALAVEPAERVPPTIARHRAVARAGRYNDSITIGFTEPVVAADAMNLANYAIECPKGTKLDLSGSTIAYTFSRWDGRCETVITLDGKGAAAINLPVNTAYVLRLANIRDLCGNKFRPGAAFEGVTEGDTTMPQIVSATWNPKVDSHQKVVDLLFSEILDGKFAQDLANFSVSTGLKVESAKLLDDGATVRLVLNGPVTLTNPAVWSAVICVVAVVLGLLIFALSVGWSALARNTARVLSLVMVIFVFFWTYYTRTSQTTVTVKGARDLAGNERTKVESPGVMVGRSKAPRITSVTARALRPPALSAITVEFDQPVNPVEAEDPKNYRIETANGQGLSAEAFELRYDSIAHKTTLSARRDAPDLLAAHPGKAYSLRVGSIHNMSGDDLAPESLKGKIRGNLKPPIPVRAWQNLKSTAAEIKEDIEDILNKKGLNTDNTRAIDVTFDKPLDRSSAQDETNYRGRDGQRTLVAMLMYDLKTVRLLVSEAVKPVIPGETRLIFRNVKDEAGNPIATATDQAIAPYEGGSLRVRSVQARANPGVDNDTIIINFDRRLVPSTATVLANYRFESPVGKPVDLTGCSVSYNAPSSTTTITLNAAGKRLCLTRGLPYKLTVAKLQDIAGNFIKENTSYEAFVRGDSISPNVVEARQNLEADPYGRTVDVLFDEAMNRDSAGLAANYRDSSGQEALSVEIRSVPPKPADTTTLKIVSGVTDQNLRRTMSDLSSMPVASKWKSRVVGYGGDIEARDYIVKRLKDLKLDPKVESFDVAVPVEKGRSRLVLADTGEEIEMCCLWPNKVRTPSLPAAGVEGHLVYGGKGEFAEYNGKEMMDSVVILDFNSGMNYFNARMLGAKAVLFYASDGVCLSQAVDKFVEVPSNIPRYWIEKKDAERLIAMCKTGPKSPKVRLFARMDWEEVPAYNIYAYIEGSDEVIDSPTNVQQRRWKDRMVILDAYYDSISIAPKQAPGADSAASAAALLEIARVLTQERRPKYTVLFLFTSAHYQSLSGINNFLYRHLRKSEFFRDRMAENEIADLPLFTNPELAKIDRKKDPRGYAEARKPRDVVFIGLDLSSHNDQVAALSEGTFYNYGWWTDNYKKNALSPLAKKLFSYYEEVYPPESAMASAAKSMDVSYLESRKYINAITPSKRSWRHYVHTSLGLNSEAVTFVGYFGISLATAHDIREFADTPLDTMDNVDVRNVATQAQTVAALLVKATQDAEFFPDTKLKFKDYGHSMKGNIYWFDRNVNFFVPKAPIEGAVVTYQLSRERSRAGVRTLVTAMTSRTNPDGGDEKRGYHVENITSDGSRILVQAWDKETGDKAREHYVDSQTRFGRFRYPLKYNTWTNRWEAMINLERKIHGLASVIWASSLGLIVLIGCILLAALIQKKTRGLRVVLTCGILGAILVPAGWASYVYVFQKDPRLAPDDPNRPYDTRVLPEIKLCAANGRETVFKDVDVSYGKFKGQFFYDVRRLRWSLTVRAYKLDDSGAIVFAPDLGQEGDKTYPTVSPYGWWETQMLEVLFPCRSLDVFETIDSRYLTALDWPTILNAQDSIPQWWGVDWIGSQSWVEGKTVEAVTVYAKPGERVKVLMSSGLLGVKYLLSNSPEHFFDNPVGPQNPDPKRQKVTEELKAKAMGSGYPIEDGVIFRPAYKGGKDMWIIDDVRLKELLSYGITNERIEVLHGQARIALEDATKYLAEKRYDRFIECSREAWGLEARGYPDVISTARDTVNGIVFYFTLLLPFAFFGERLLFGFTDIRRRVIAFAGIFVSVFFILRYVHPAFKLSSSPYIIFIAFVILALGSIVLIFILSKFNQEVQKIKRAASGVYEVDVGRISATFAAISLGISNLRKRPLRSFLTAMTLVLLTFTALSFTSVRTLMEYYRLPRDNRPPYQGVMVRDRSWKGLQPSVLRYLRSAFDGRAAYVAPRAWRISKQRDEREYIKFIEPTAPENKRISFANAIVGLTPQEASVTHIDQFLVGENSRWFKTGDRNVVILPSDMAALVQIKPEDAGKKSVELLGDTYLVIGIIDSDRFNRYLDMDDEKMTPVDTVSEGDRMVQEKNQDPDLLASEPIEAFIHLESTNVMLMPYDTVMDLGGTLRSVAITGFLKQKWLQEVEHFMSRVALTVFVGEGDRVVVYSSIGHTTLSGIGTLFVPILIAALIVLNTMMGSVYERFREIGIYSSVGLAPNHIAALFIAEAAVFATVGAVMGYLIGQVTTLVLSHYGILKGMNLNYSSLSAISSTLIVMATVFLSTLYPAKKAADMAVPDVTRKWKFPEPQGDDWIFDFPFTVGGAEIVGMYSYLSRVFESYGEGSTGVFVTESVRFSEAPSKIPDQPRYVITMKTWLAPYDLGISQDVKLDAVPTGEHNIYRVEVTLHRVSGDVASWRRINRGFLNVLRKRFLVWRTIGRDEKQNYEAQGRAVLSGHREVPAPLA